MEKVVLKQELRSNVPQKKKGLPFASPTDSKLSPCSQMVNRRKTGKLQPRKLQFENKTASDLNQMEES